MSVITRSSEKSQRFGSIDAVRGAAILFVFLSHFTSGYGWSPQSQNVADYLRTLTMIAAPTFVIVSGMVAGFLAATNPRGFGELRIKLFDRGIFLLVVGHLALTLTQLPSAAHFAAAYRVSFITDAIAVAIMIGPSVVAYLGTSARLALAGAIFAGNWWLISHWHPIASAVPFKLYLIGYTSQWGQLGAYTVFPVLPWVAVYLVGTSLGSRVGSMYVAGERRNAHYVLARVGAACFLGGTVAHFFARELRNADPAIYWDINRLTFFSIYGKFPPGIVYLCFFGGAGLMMLAAIFELDRQGKFPLLLSELRKLGRSSLFIFTIQYALYRSVIPRLHLPYAPFWPFIFLASVVALGRLAAIWDGYSANRFLTVGITSAWREHVRGNEPSAAQTRPAGLLRVRIAGANSSLDR